MWPKSHLISLYFPFEAVVSVLMTEPSCLTEIFAPSIFIPETSETYPSKIRIGSSWPKIKTGKSSKTAMRTDELVL